MKNKWLRRKVLAIILVLAMCPVPVYSEESCEHNYVETGRVEASCVAEGSIDLECPKCHELKSETISKIPHAYVETVNIPPRCNGSYASTFTCSGCGDSYTETYDPLPHNFVDNAVLDPGDCSHDAMIQTICTACGMYGTEFKPGDPNAHYYDIPVVVKRQTCTEDGLNQQTCFNCGHVKDIVVPAIGGSHMMFFVPSQTVTATCATEGKTVWVCANTPCGYKEVITSPKLTTHSWMDDGVAVPATCAATGVMTTKCIHCEATGTREIPKQSHDFYEVERVKATCGEDGYVLFRCRNCGSESQDKIYKETVPHNHVKVDAESKAATCKEDGLLVVRCDGCGDTQTSVVSKLTVPHSYELTEELDPTCVADGYKKETCSVCGDLATTSYPADAAYHGYEVVAKVPETCIADGSEDYECRYCGDTKTETIPMSEDAHNWVDTANCKAATCTDDGIDEKQCTFCSGLDTKVIPALGHNMDDGEVLIERDCINDGQVKYTCKTCGHEEYDHPAAYGHDFVFDYTVDATCIEVDYEVFSCTRCGASDIRNKGTDYGDHDYIESGMTEPTCGVDGVREFTCSLCSAVRQDIICHQFA